jgi:hypothetical protein
MGSMPPMGSMGREVVMGSMHGLGTYIYSRPTTPKSYIRQPNSIVKESRIMSPIGPGCGCKPGALSGW